MKKNNFKSLAAVLSLAMAATAVPVNADAAKAPKLTVNADTVYSGETYTATVKNLKKGYTVQFSSTEGGVNFKSKKVKVTGKSAKVKFTVKAAKKIADGLDTKIKAVVKDSKGKKVKTVTKKVTLKQLATALTVKDVAETTVKVGAEVNADATIAPAAAKGAYAKTFTSSDSSVLKVTDASNGTFEAVAPGTATISVTAANDDGVVVEGSKTIVITVVAAEEEKPEDTTPEVKPDEKPEVSTEAAISTEYKLSLKSSKAQITADNIDSADIEVRLTAPTDAEINKDMVAAVQLGLSTDGVGSLSAKEVNLNYNESENAWIGVVKFTSASLTKDATSKLTASISSTVNAAADLNLKGVSAEPIDIILVAPVKEVVDETVAAKATKVVAESLDRITITFNKSVKRENYLTVDGKVANGMNAQTVNGVTTSPEAFKLYIRDGVSDNVSVTDLNEVKSKYTFTENDIVDIVTVSDNTLTFVLRNDISNNNTGLKSCLTDNSKFLVDFIDQRAGFSAVESGVLYNRTLDTTNPSVMKVDVVDMKTLRVQFTQPLYSVAADANNASVRASVINALTLANYSIDGQILSKTWIDANGNNIYGNASSTDKAVTISLEDATKRDTVIIKLGKKEDGTQCYLSAGPHVLQVSNVGDYAALTETGVNNRVETKNFDFTVAANTAEPTFNVVAQSAEQYKVTFTTPIAKLEKYTEGQEVDKADLGIDLVYKDTVTNTFLTAAMTEYKSATAAYGAGTGLGQEIKVTKLANDANGNPQVKVEVTKDWTQLNDYINWNKTYYNYALGLKVAKDGLMNSANGKTNSVDVMKPLVGDAVTKVDATTPVMMEISEVTAGSKYAVSFSEPVQASNATLVNASTNNYAHAFTPSRNADGTTAYVGEMTAQIVNNANKLTYNATITGWNGYEDASVFVETAQKLPGGDYTLYVRGVSDDIGNTSNTLSRTFTVAGEVVDTSFKVLTILADKAYGDTATATATGSGIYSLENNGAEADAIYVEFSTQYAAGPIIDSVLNTANWTINGAALPVGSTIIQGIAGMGGGASLKTGHSGITIYLPNGTLSNIDSTSVKVAANVKDTAGKAITGKTTLNTQTIFVGSTFDATGNIVQDGQVINATSSNQTNVSN